MIRKYLQHFSHLFYPHVCEGCGSDVVLHEQLLCARCMHRLPYTGYPGIAGNPVEKLFYGRCRLEAAAAAFYFSKHSLVQHLLLQLKYHGNREAGYFLGRMMGRMIADSGRFDEVELLVPLPLNPKKEFMRGYNQAAIICNGIAETWPRSIAAALVERVRFTETQTRKDRLSRWQNMQNVFHATDENLLQGRHVLLVDDVITTGATLEACGNALLGIPGLKLSVAAAAFTS